MAISSVANQTRRPEHLTIYDDNDPPTDLRKIEIYQHLLRILDTKGIGWDVVYGRKMGQHHNHQIANRTDYDAIWRLDDDCVAEPDVLEKLAGAMKADVGAVGGSIIVPGTLLSVRPNDASSLIGDIYRPNRQWYKIERPEEVDHLHCSFLYRPRIVDYDLRLSKKAHREETMFTYSLKLKGYKILIVPCITWHFKSQVGGIRSDNDIGGYRHDEALFEEWLKFQKAGKRLFVLNGGLGDNYMFLEAMGKLPKGSVVATCYPDLYKNMDVEIVSIAFAHRVIDVESHNVYAWCGMNKWKGHLIDAFREMHRRP